MFQAIIDIYIKCFCIGLCWDLGMLEAMIDITSEHNVSKNNKNLLFSAALS